MKITEDIILGDGKTYQAETLTMGDYIEVQKKFGKDALSRLDDMEVLSYLLYLAVRKKHKDMTLEKMLDILDANFLNSGGSEKIVNVFLKVNGITKEMERKNEVAPKLGKNQ